MKAAKAPQGKKHGPVTLKAVAEHLGLTPGTVSAVLNNSAAARSIPEHTRKRILEGARLLNYRPNFLARSLRVQRTSPSASLPKKLATLTVAWLSAALKLICAKMNSSSSPLPIATILSCSIPIPAC